MSEGLKERTAKGLMWGAINNLTTQLLSVLIGIVLGRLLTPSEYGMVGMLAIFTAIAGSLQDSGFTAALTNLKQATHREYNAVFWFSTLMALLIYLLLYFTAPLIASFLHQPELVSLSRLVFASLLMAGIGIAHAAYMFRNMMNREKAITSFFALAGSGIIGITLALKGYSYWSLAWQQFAYITIINIGRLYYVRWMPSLKVDFTPIREMFGFSSKILVTNIMTQVNNNVLSLIFGRLFNAGAVGNYTQAAKWNTMGHSLISGTIQQVAQPVLASISDEEDRQLKVFRKMLRFTAFLSMPAMLGLALIADFIVLLLGQQWTDSVLLLRILCISGAFLPIQTLYQNLFISLRKIRQVHVVYGIADCSANQRYPHFQHLGTAGHGSSLLHDTHHLDRGMADHGQATDRPALLRYGQGCDALPAVSSSLHGCGLLCHQCYQPTYSQSDCSHCHRRPVVHGHHESGPSEDIR